MISFDPKFFKAMEYARGQIENFLAMAGRYLKIAGQSEFAEVKFQFSYNALIALGICLIAAHGYKVSSRSGHHVKIIEKLADIMADGAIAKIGHKMREARNKDLYDGGAGLIMTDKLADEYFVFAKKVSASASGFLKERLGRLL